MIEGSGTDRPRQAAFNIQRVGSGGTDISTDISMVTSSIGVLSFQDDNASNWEFLSPEYAVVPWSKHGRGQLTIELAFFWTTLGPHTEVASRYQRLDSWGKGGQGYVRNTSDLKMEILPKRAVIYEGDVENVE
ncbi:hypothetical protein GGS23DRAFT_340457 [Durotheca rogersii]|uniref:uncharacterized protein n=1 Tax=Durotheca rogersii TaxID=419775 RepID=UPI00221F7422|nr:uncharacterized protein GGS23DRAFT_340457 [Durotheca rogersii]KAI5858237.1 hypothetical protein GGS23DRAFT_340457 [Durotheca rogersii]